MARKAKVVVAPVVEVVEVEDHAPRAPGRPKNITVLHNGEVVSVTPNEFKNVLTARLDGVEPVEIEVVGRRIGEVNVDLARLTKRAAKEMLATL